MTTDSVERLFFRQVKAASLEAYRASKYPHAYSAAPELMV